MLQYQLMRIFQLITHQTEMNEFCEEAYYIQASSHLCRGDNEAAYKIMKGAAIQLETPSRNTLKMCAYIAVRIMPPRFMEAIDSFGSILKSNPRDFEVVRLCTLGNFRLNYIADDYPSERTPVSILIHRDCSLI